MRVRKREEIMKIVSIAISKKKRTRKAQIDQASLIQNHGLKGDAHAGPWHRQVSFLASESIEASKKKGFDVTFGDFAENIATSGINWRKIPVSTLIHLGDSAIVKITQIGKECHNKCAIYYLAGDCIMPKEGIFGQVFKGGEIHCGDMIRIIRDL